MQKNTASQKWIVFAFQDEGGTNPGDPVTGDAANITANVRIDGGAANAVDDTNPTELEDGYYVFDITAAECNGDLILITPASATANVQVIGVPGALWTTPANFSSAALTATGAIGVDWGNVENAGTTVDLSATSINLADTVTTLTGHTAQTGDNYARLGAPAGASVSADIAAVKTDTAATLVDTGTTIPATLGTPAGASMSADIAAVKTDTAATLVDTGTTLPATLATAAALTTVDTVVDAIKAKTDDLTFGVANTLNANITYVNEIAVTGDGQSGTEWGPA